MNMIIRPARHEDAENIAALGLCVWIDTYATDGARTALSKYALSYFSLDHVRDLLASRKVLVAEMSEHLVAFVVLVSGDRTIEIDNFYVLPRFQRLGIGRKLIGAISEEHPHVWLACWEDNQKAIAFYKSLGFVEDGETFFNLDGESYRNILLVRSGSKIKGVGAV